MSWVKEELFCRIRHDAAFEGLSIRALARKHGVHRRLVREALSSPQPKPRRPPVRRSPRLDPFKKTIDEWLRADLEAPHKQRHTAKRIRSRLAEEFDAEVPYPTVRDYVTARRPQIAVEAGAPLDGFIIRHNRPGADAEVDFGEVMVRLDGALTRCHLFAFRLAYSGLAVHRVTVSCGQEAFFEGHEYAFGVIGGVPVGQIRYDNLTAAVRRVIFRSRSRVENPRWEAFRRYYGFTAFYCQAGPEGAHEKGGVEGQVGYYRRNRLTPVPEVASLAQLNERLEAADLADRNRKIKMRSGCIGEDFAVEASLLGPLPEEPFAAGLTLRPRVDLPTIRGQCAELVARAERDHLSYRGLLAELLMAECDERDRRRSERRLHAAGFPRPKSLSDFDFAANSNVNAALVNTLATCEWVRVGQPLCLIGDSGTGKSHLLIGLGSAAAMAGYRVRYTLAAKLVNELVEAADDKVLSKTITRYGRVDLLCIDELGYLELDRRGAEMLFQVLTEREEKNSVAIASNESFSGWTRTFTDPRLCAAIVDRLTFNGTIIETGTESYRLTRTKAKQPATSTP